MTHTHTHAYSLWNSACRPREWAEWPGKQHFKSACPACSAPSPLYFISICCYTGSLISPPRNITTEVNSGTRNLELETTIQCQSISLFLLPIYLSLPLPSIFRLSCIDIASASRFRTRKPLSGWKLPRLVNWSRQSAGAIEA